MPSGSPCQDRKFVLDANRNDYDSCRIAVIHKISRPFAYAQGDNWWGTYGAVVQHEVAFVE